VLDATAIIEAEQRARRFSGAYTGTSGTLAADVLRLIADRKELMTQLEEANQALRQAVADRLAGTPTDDPKMAGYTPMAASLAGCKPAQEAAARCFDTTTQSVPVTPEEPVASIPVDWILQGERELRQQRLTGDGVKNAPSDTYAEWQPSFQGDALRPGSAEFLAVLDELKQLHLRKTLDYGVDEDALSNIRMSADIVNLPAWAGCVLRMMDKMHRLRAYFRRGKVEFDGLEDTLKDIACYAVIAEVLRREGHTPCLAGKRQA
jgi:hypothetical protein